MAKYTSKEKFYKLLREKFDKAFYEEANKAFGKERILTINPHFDPNSIDNTLDDKSDRYRYEVEDTENGTNE